MLMFVFGAGASYDSDSHRLVRELREDDDFYNEYRPPLATGIFEPRNRYAKEAAAAFKRATPLLMRLRNAAARGADVEEVLEQLQGDEERYSATASQLLALRAYLARLLATGPSEWSQECAGQTNYVLALDEAARWNEAVQEPGTEHPVACVTFNYDALLEAACERVFGVPLYSIADFITDTRVRIYKPHGSVEWRQKALWEAGPQDRWDGDEALHWAIDQAPGLRWQNEFKLADRDDGDYQDGNDAGVLWLPALAIPALGKASFTMPDDHRESLEDDLRRATLIIAIGWRAREQHFLSLVEQFVPEGCALVAVAESETAAMQTVDTLWTTGRFGRYLIAGEGFSHFVGEPLAVPVEPVIPGPGSPRLRDVLTGDLWLGRAPGAGFRAQADRMPLSPPSYRKM